MAYDAKAHEFTYGFYARGWSKARALVEIRKVYAGFSGSTWEEWEKSDGWKERRALADAKLRDFEDTCRDTARLLLLELNHIREELYARVKDGGAADTQTVYAYTSVVKQIADLSSKHLATRSEERVAMEVLNAAISNFLAGLRQIEGLAAALEQHADAVVALVTSVAEQFGREA
jgi:hypothetical protein